MSDTHDHEHPHGPALDAEVPGYFDMLETAVRELLIEKGYIQADEIRRQIEMLDSRNPALGARVVARAWVDSDSRRAFSRTAARHATNSGSRPMTTRS